MAYRFSTGFETGDAAELVGGTLATGFTVQSTIKRSGSFALKNDSTTSNEQNVLDFLNAPTLYTSLYFYIDVLSTPGADKFGQLLPYRDRATNALLGYLARIHRSSGVHNLYLWNQVASVSSDQSAVTVTPGVWNRLELKMAVSPTDGVMELKVNGDVAAALTAQNLGSSPIDVVRFRGEVETAGVSQGYFDDVEVLKTMYPSDRGAGFPIVPFRGTRPRPFAPGLAR